ncbi:RNA polymerase sigma factor [candidate division KSB1 bacterium]|nr:RNA polymerase sigma factor [candidate division KSB1 bacterium]
MHQSNQQFHVVWNTSKNNLKEEGDVPVNKLSQRNNIDPNAMDRTDERMIERNLVEAVRRSDSDAYKEIYCKYHSSLSRFIYSRVQQTELTRDLVQEVFLRVWNTRYRLDPKKSIKAYFYQVANNLVIDTMRKKKHRENYLKIATHPQYYSSEELINTALDVHKAIEQLPEKLKVVILLSRFEGLTYNEIAESCQISIKTVVYRMRKAMEMMTKLLSLKTQL